MKAFLVDAGARTITPVEYEYKTMRTYLPGGICIGQTFPNGDVLYVDDLALTKVATVGFRIRSRLDGQPMMSNGLLTGRDDNSSLESTGTLDPEFTVDELLKEIEWLTLEEALGWFRTNASKPAVTITSGGRTFVQAVWGDFLVNLLGEPGGVDPENFWDDEDTYFR